MESLIVILLAFFALVIWMLKNLQEKLKHLTEQVDNILFIFKIQEKEKKEASPETVATYKTETVAPVTSAAGPEHVVEAVKETKTENPKAKETYFEEDLEEEAERRRK